MKKVKHKTVRGKKVIARKVNPKHKKKINASPIVIEFGPDAWFP